MQGDISPNDGFGEDLICKLDQNAWALHDALHADTGCTARRSVPEDDAEGHGRGEMSKSQPATPTTPPPHEKVQSVPSAAKMFRLLNDHVSFLYQVVESHTPPWLHAYIKIIFWGPVIACVVENILYNIGKCVA